MKLIAFTGSMGSGKSTAISCIKEIQTSKVELIKFAQFLYDMQEFIYKQIEPVYKRPTDFTKDRKLLQWLGTEWGRESIDKDIWLKLWKNKVLTFNRLNPDTIIVVDDVRFNNEAEIIRDLGGHLISITSNKQQERINTSEGITGHKSEQSVDFKYITGVLENNKDIDYLKSSLLTLNETISLWQ